MNYLSIRIAICTTYKLSERSQLAVLDILALTIGREDATAIEFCKALVLVCAIHI